MVAPRSVRMLGRAVVTTRLSSVTMNRATLATTSVQTDLRVMRSGLPVGALELIDLSGTWRKKGSGTVGRHCEVLVEVERGGDVEQHPRGEELTHALRVCPAGARDLVAHADEARPD